MPANRYTTGSGLTRYDIDGPLVRETTIADIVAGRWLKLIGGSVGMAVAFFVAGVVL